MDWNKIDIKAIIELLRKFEIQSLTISGEYAVIYSDGNEEVKISYKRLEETELNTPLNNGYVNM
jgi:hypothetical protein